MGKAALEGRDGVIEVTRGWKKFKEINTVRYNPDKITIEQMITILEQADTFRGVAR